MHVRTVIVAMLWAVLVPAASAFVPEYSATPLGTLGGTGGSGEGINASGEVTGFSYLPQNATWHAFVYAAGMMRDLGTFGGAISAGYSINRKGDVAGFAAGNGTTQYAFLYSNGKLTNLGTLGGTVSRATSINDVGDVTGYASNAGDLLTHAFLYSNGVMKDLGSLGTDSSGLGINASGQVTGFSMLPDVPGAGTRQHAFLYANGAMRDLGTLGGNFSMGRAINDAAQIAGDSNGDGNGVHGFLYSNGVMRDLGTLGGTSSFALDINNAGQVVGSAETAGGAQHAYLYADGAMHDLNSRVTGLAGTILTNATAINDAGQIVANGCSPSLICQAFRLDPLPGIVDPPPKLAAVEYHHADFDDYFVTVNSAEIDALDHGMFAGWTRTGQAFNAYSAPFIGTATVCRFFSAGFAPKSAHFYTHDAGECSIVKQGVGWQFEGTVMAIPVPDPAGNCAAGTQPVYRLYNNGIGGAPAHRYTTDPAMRSQMLARGWIPEGYGSDGVFMCSPT